MNKVKYKMSGQALAMLKEAEADDSVNEPLPRDANPAQTIGLRAYCMLRDPRAFVDQPEKEPKP